MKTIEAAQAILNDPEAMSLLDRLLIGNKTHTVKGALREIVNGKSGVRQT